MKQQLSLFFTAVQFLTRLPAPSSAEFQAQWLARSARYFPLVGVLVGVINVGIWRLAAGWFPPSVSVGLMLAASLLITGAFHEDGFADTCDGLGGGTTLERTLEIMKDSRIGAYGAIGVVSLLGLKWTTLVALPAAALPMLVVGAHAVSRWCALGLIWRMPYIRDDSSAKSKPFADTLSGPEWLVSGIIGMLGFAPIALFYMHDPGALNVAEFAAASVAAAGVTFAAAAYLRGRIGGYTGDCLGAVQQLAELAFLLGGLAWLGPARRLA